MSRRTFVTAATAAGAVANAGGSAIAATAADAGIPTGASNFGASPDDQGLNEAWKTFCRQLETAGSKVFKDYNPPLSTMRADGFRFLTQNLGQAFDLFYETRDPKFPHIFTFCTPFCKLGGDNADCIYQQAWVDGESQYKITGNKGTARFFNIAVQGPKPEMPPGSKKRPLHDPFGDVPEENIFGHQIETEWDGSFELYIGGPKRGPNWVPTTPGTRKLFIRQYFDNFSEVPARMRIERLGMTDPRPVPTAQDMEKAIGLAGKFMTELMNDWPDWTYDFLTPYKKEELNKFPANPYGFKEGAYNPATDKKRGRSIEGMNWELAPDEALIIEFDNPGTFWMLTNMGMFMNSMDYLYRPISWTPSRTKVDSDNKIRFVMAHDDPGFHNWIDTSGFTRGNMTSRNVMSELYINYRTRVVKRSKVDAAMPKDSARVTREERTKLMLERFHAIQKRYAV
jgi:hypothetical protein